MLIIFMPILILVFKYSIGNLELSKMPPTLPAALITIVGFFFLKKFKLYLYLVKSNCYLLHSIIL